jgi:hypothetical protein
MEVDSERQFGRRSFSRQREEKPFATEEDPQVSERDGLRVGRRRSFSANHNKSQIVFNDHAPADAPPRTARQNSSCMPSQVFPASTRQEEPMVAKGIRTDYTRPTSSTPFATLSDLRSPLDDEDVSPQEKSAPPFATLSDLVSFRAFSHVSVQAHRPSLRCARKALHTPC